MWKDISQPNVSQRCQFSRMGNILSQLTLRLRKGRSGLGREESVCSAQFSYYAVDVGVGSLIERLDGVFLGD